MDTPLFIAASASLLMMPGPTNALLATAGAAMEGRQALRLLAGVIGGYTVSILLLTFLIGPVIAALPSVGLGLRLAVMAYLFVLAAKLWTRGNATEPASSAAVTLRDVFVTTALNPKSMILAFVILPQTQHFSELAPQAALLALIVLISSAAWIGIGAAARRGFATVLPAKLCYRMCAMALLVMGGTVSAQAFM